MRLLVTPYKNPDLDGTACAFAYAEFLTKNNKNVIATVFGKPHREAQYVLNKFNIPNLKNGNHIIDHVDGIIIVDASDLGGLSDKVKPDKVVEIIDHRIINQANLFPNAKVQIELVGSAATLIAEKYFYSKITISQESSALLFSAIVSNTINFQANVTTKRDLKMANWLKTKFVLPPNYVHHMFLYKSQFTKPLKATIIDDFATFNFGNCNLGIGQLEIINVVDFIQRNIVEIKDVLREIKRDKSLDRIFLTCIDLEKAFNQIVVIDQFTQSLLKQALRIKFVNRLATRKGILMRKEIVPLVKEALEVPSFTNSQNR